MAGLVLDSLRGVNAERRGMWMMRQAGRYLPEYRALRAAKGGFLAMVEDSETAAAITLQPLERFGFDAAILFSDILMGPYAMGQDLGFVEAEGPRLSPPLIDTTLAALHAVPARLDPVYATVRRVKAALAPDKTLLGFAGAPWTVATYMVAGEGSRDHYDARVLSYRDPAGFAAIIDAITEVTITYLAGQIAAGAEAVQLFDSWAGSLAPDAFERWVIAPHAAISVALHQKYPEVPIIGFARGAGAKLAPYAREAGVDAIGLDETIDPLWAAEALPRDMPVQGNLDPMLLLAGGPQLGERVTAILDALSVRPHVFNLGHGIDRRTPLAHVEAMLSAVRGWRNPAF